MSCISSESVQNKMDCSQSSEKSSGEQVSSVKSSNEISLSPETQQFLEKVFRDSGFVLDSSNSTNPAS
jgi:hypothetical protein